MSEHHQPRLVQSAHVQHAVHGTGRVARINSAIALFVTSKVGTMWCAYAFCALSFYGLPAALSGGAGAFVQWASSQFIQLVLLPIIIVGQNVQQAHNDARAEADHETLTVLSQINHQQLELIQQSHEMLTLLKGKEGN